MHNNCSEISFSPRKTNILNKSAKYKFDPAPTVGENDGSNYDDKRIAISYYIDEEEHDLGDVMNKIKKG